MGLAERTPLTEEQRQHPKFKLTSPPTPSFSTTLQRKSGFQGWTE
jgi:hypothetical protein